MSKVKGRYVQIDDALYFRDADGHFTPIAQLMKQPASREEVNARLEQKLQSKRKR